jgi:hypothetical protein
LPNTVVTGVLGQLFLIFLWFSKNNGLSKKYIKNTQPLIEMTPL